MSAPLKILIVAAEASSSLYAERLLEYWKDQYIDVQAFGVGSRSMEKLGFRALGYAEEMAVVGIKEVFANWSLIRGVFHKLVEEAERIQPDCVLLMDYPEFNFRLAKKMKGLGLKTIYYISPQLWAWRQGRVKLVKKYIDHMLVLFPFEKEFYEKHGVKAEFVGHPLLDEIKPQWLDPQSIRLERQRCGIPDHMLVLGLMPGSRNSEIEHHLDIQILAAEKICEQMKNVRPVLMVAPTLNIESLRDRLPKKLNMNLQVMQKDPREMIQLADLILCASGTATLIVGLLQKPMVIMYRMSRLTVFIGRRIVKPMAYFGLPNLILNQSVCPEIFQEQVTVENLTTACVELLKNPEKRKEMEAKLKTLVSHLGEKGVTERVARFIAMVTKEKKEVGSEKVDHATC